MEDGAQSDSMASTCLLRSFSEDLTCSICLSVFTEPAMLQCGHWFCRECISESLDNRKHCPVCRARVSTRQSLLTSHVLKSMVEKTQLKLQYRHDRETAEFLCPEHDEKLKLFCITDQQLICVICRDAHKHQSHQFKPVSEAAALVSAELQNLSKKINADTKALETLSQSQKKEVDVTKQRAEELRSLIGGMFEQFYAFLQKRERELLDEVKSSEENGLKMMTEWLSNIEAAIADNRKLEATVTSALQVQDHERFLKMWSEEEKAKTIKSFKPKGSDFQVEQTGLSLGPYESHLQLFVWKEMLQIVTPREEQLLLKSGQTKLRVSQDQRSATFCHYYSKQYEQIHGHYETPSTLSTNTFAGQHYWEVYVGGHSNWHVGLAQSYLKHSAGAYKIFTSGYSCTSVEVQGNPQKIGIYLNSSRKELSFYNADNMALILTASLAYVSFPVSAYFKLGNSHSNHDPIMVCRY